jgi:hypothetical protein
MEGQVEAEAQEKCGPPRNVEVAVWADTRIQWRVDVNFRAL